MVNKFCHFGLQILNLQIKSPFLTRKLSFWTIFFQRAKANLQIKSSQITRAAYRIKIVIQILNINDLMVFCRYKIRLIRVLYFNLWLHFQNCFFTNYPQYRLFLEVYAIICKLHIHNLVFRHRHRERRRWHRQGHRGQLERNHLHVPCGVR